MFTSDSLSNLANNSLRILTKSDAEYVDDMAVNPTMSAYKILKQRRKKCKFGLYVITIFMKHGIWINNKYLPFMIKTKKKKKHDIAEENSISFVLEFLFYLLQVTWKMNILKLCFKGTSHDILQYIYFKYFDKLRFVLIGIKWSIQSWVR